MATQIWIQSDVAAWSIWGQKTPHKETKKQKQHKNGFCSMTRFYAPRSLKGLIHVLGKPKAPTTHQ
jgi:hypothetical protein